MGTVSVTVEIHGIDAYGRTIGHMRSSSTDDIVTWFVNTGHDSESFLVRYACFTGAGESLERRSRRLKADIDQNACQQSYTTTLMLFAVPETSNIVVQVIDLYGDGAVNVYIIQE